MRLGIFNSKILTLLTLCLFIFLLTSEASSLRGFQDTESFAKLVSEGEAFYKSKEYDKAVIRYLEAYMQAKNNIQFAEVYMGLGLTYTANGQKDKAKEYLLKLLQLQPDKKIDEQKYPADFVILFYKTQIEALKPAVEAAKPTTMEAVPEEEKETSVKTEGSKEFEPKTEKPETKTAEKKVPPPAGVEETKKIEPKVEIKKAEPEAEPKTQPVEEDKPKELPDKLKDVPGVGATQKEDITKKEEKPAAEDAEAAAKEDKAAKKEEKAATQEEPKEPVIMEQKAQGAKVEGKKKIPWLLIAGVAVIGGALAYLLLSGSDTSEDEATAGSIQVNSSPTGAKVLLDGMDTGKVTNTTLTGIAPGSHQVKVSKEGYVDYEETVSVTAGQTVIVDVSLSKHTISVSTPKANDVWVIGQTVQIKWNTGGSSAARKITQSHFNPLLSESGSSRAFLRLKVYREREAMRVRNHESLKGAVGGEEESDGLARVRKVIGELSPTVRERTPAPVTQPVDGKCDSGQNPAILNINLSSPRGQNRVNPSGDLNIQAVSQVKIELFQGSKRIRTIASSTLNDGQHNWKVASEVPDGFDYRVKVSAAEEPSVSGTSKAFMVKSNYTLAAKWGSRGSGDDQFNAPMGITVTQSKVYIVEDANARIKIYTPQGTLLNMWGGPGMGDDRYNNPRGVAVANNGNIYIADTGNERIVVCKPSGAYLREWGSRGGGVSQFRSPTDIAIDKSGDVYVADSYNFRIQKFNASGKFIGQFGTRGIGDDQFGLPVGIAVDDNGNVYVVDSENNRIQKFSSSRQFLTKWGKRGNGEGEFNHPTGIAIGTDGKVYVTDSENHRIQKFDSVGNFITSWGTQGDGDAQFRFPTGIAVDNSGKVYISDSGNYRIMKFKVAE